MLLLSWSATAVFAAGAEETDTVHGHALEGAMHLNEVVVTGVTGRSLLKNTPAAMTVVGAKELESTPSTNIIDALARQAGVAQVTTGAGISKPVIRGMGYNRVLVVNDGVRQEGQQWGDEHGVEIDGASVGSVEILKGPASLMYGSDALAGVLLMNPLPLLPEGEMKAGGQLEYQTNSGLYGYSANFRGHRGDWVWNWRYSGRGAHAFKTPLDGYVPGSAYREQAMSGMTGLHRNWGFTHLTLSAYYLQPGIAEGERDAVTGLLSGEGGRSYGIRTPFQRVTHLKAVSDNTFYLGDASLKLLLAYQQNRRKEFEESAADYDLFFRLHTVNYQLRYLSTEINGWKMATGIGGMWQRSENLGTEYLVPAYHLFDAGVFATASKAFGPLNFSGGLRYDMRWLHSYGLEEEGTQRFVDFSRRYQGLTGSVGMTWEMARELNLKVNLSRGFRAPNISELGSNGEHEGTLRYEMGQTGLKAEKSWQADLGLDYSSALFSVEAALFVNYVEDYIYSARMTDNAGLPVSTDGLPAYIFMSGNARLAGGELTADFHPWRRLHVENAFSWVDARLLHQPAEAEYLPMTPAPRWTAEVKYDIIRQGRGAIDQLYLKGNMEMNARQSHIYLAGGTETETAGYTLFGIQAGATFKYKGRHRLSVYLTGENLFNKAYQSHLNRLKYADEDALTGRQGVLNAGRNFIVKLVIF